MRNRKREATRKGLVEFDRHFFQLGMGISLALLLVAWILTAGEQPSLMVTILVAAIASGLISAPVDRAAQALWRYSMRTPANTTDALWEPDWPEAIEARRSVRQWRRRRRWVYVVFGGMLWAFIFGVSTFLLASPQDQWQHDPTKETALVLLVVALPMGLFGFIVGATIAYKRTADW